MKQQNEKLETREEIMTRINMNLRYMQFLVVLLVVVVIVRTVFFR